MLSNDVPIISPFFCHVEVMRLRRLAQAYDAAFRTEPWKISSVKFGFLCSYGPLPVISTYNPIYRMYNPIVITSY